MAPLIRFHGGASAVLAPGRPGRRRARGGPPGAPPPDDDGGRGGGGDGQGGMPAGGADGVGPFALGLALFGITTLFVVLIAVWLFLRRPAPDWRASDAAAPDALWISTACLLASSVAVEAAARLVRRESGRRAAWYWLVASLVLGLAFLAAQVQLWAALWRSGLVPAASGYAAVFFALTGLHALHVVGGLAFLGFLVLRLRVAVRAAAPAPRASVRLGAVYWHYMGAIWLVLFTLLYFVR